MRVRRGVAVFAAVTAIAPASASAAMRYTAPAGSGSACTQASPCSLTEGVGGASSGDEVRMTADEYTLTSQLPITVPNLTISGPPGRYTPSQAQAFIIFNPPAWGLSNILVQADGFALKRVNISGRSGAQVMINSTLHRGMLLDRVRIFDGGSEQTVVAQESLIFNSVIRQDAGGYAAVGITGAIYGSTITSATGRAIVNDDAYHVPPDFCQLQVTNTIAIGAVRNLDAVDGGSGCSPTVEYAYSWIPVAAGYGGGGIAPSGFITSVEANLPDSPPALSAPLSGEIGLALGSPAINAGCGGSCGVEDFYGRPRPIGAGNDIGATETILPPTVNPARAGGLTATTASVSSAINPNGGATAYRFQLRKAGASTWRSIGASTTGEGAVAGRVSAVARRLEPATGYQVRVSASNSAGSATSPVSSFRTPRARISVSALKAKVTRRSFYLTSRAATTSGGRITQAATTGSGRRARTWCRASRTVSAAGSFSLKCDLGRKGRSQLRKRAFRLTVKTSFKPTTGSTLAVTRTLKVKRKR